MERIKNDLWEERQSNPEELLEEIGNFIFDELHNLSDSIFHDEVGINEILGEGTILNSERSKELSLRYFRSPE